MLTALASVAGAPIKEVCCLHCAHGCHELPLVGEPCDCPCHGERFGLLKGDREEANRGRSHYHLVPLKRNRAPGAFPARAHGVRVQHGGENHASYTTRSLACTGSLRIKRKDTGRIARAI